ncbi:MMPL family transporter [Dethiobacter alkaliphilus]|uniref:MMPL family transporter n=1 Tax=Dethiobacter alkaliphilus TaxID=427926 RepID=UPI0022260E26|nr:MMPL family transporter [Dethiobacter alkaliphilus]MCW3489458.1 MMPL family transporter [Dethiobacter alkaliphilus]
MQNLFARLSEKIMKKPVLTVFCALLVAVFLVAGVLQIRMATGNETFIRTDTDTYRDNLQLENTFGGENIMIHLKTEDMADLLTVENLDRFDTLERLLLQNENVYSVIGPASTVRHITAKQADNILDNVGEMRDGLAEMSERLSDIALAMTEMEENAPEIDFSQMTGQFNQSSKALEQLISGQQQLGTGIDNLTNGYGEFGNMVTNVAINVEQIGGGLEVELQKLPLPEQEKQELLQKTAGLRQSAAALNQAGSNMLAIADESQSLQQVPLQTADGLTAMQQGLTAQSGQLSAMQSEVPDISQLAELGEGLEIFSEKLLHISQGLDTLLENSNIMSPALPSNQDTLEMILYDDGDLRPMFAQMVIDDYNALLVVRLTGNAADSQIEEVVTLINNTLDRDPLEGTDVTVTGKPVLDIALRTEMRSSMQRMVISALILMVIIVSVVFKVRWRLFPLVVNFGAVVASMGLMAHLGIPMTMVSMAAFPILIGLGIDYSIQFHNRYEEEYVTEEANNNEI